MNAYQHILVCINISLPIKLKNLEMLQMPKNIPNIHNEKMKKKRVEPDKINSEILEPKIWQVPQ